MSNDFRCPLFTYLPELLAGIFAANSLQDLCAARVLVHETSHLIYIVINDDVQSLLNATRFLDIVRGELFRHGGWARSVFEAWYRVNSCAMVVCVAYDITIQDALYVYRTRGHPCILSVCCRG